MQTELNVPKVSAVSSPAESPSRGIGRTLRRLVKFVLTVALLVAGGFAYVHFSPGSDDSEADEEDTSLLVHTVRRGDFESFVTESGDIESSSNVEVKCEVKSTAGAAATTILKITEEGTIVEEGDFLIQFDDSTLKLTLTQQEIQVATDEAAVIQAQSELDKAIQTLNEYKDGLYLVDRDTYESEVFQARSHLQSAQESLTYSERMFKKGYVSRIQLEAEKLAVEMARKAAKAAETKLMVLNDFTLKKTVSEYEAEIEKQKALLKAVDYTLKLSQERRDELKDQIEKCHVLAPAPGQVVYANDFERRNNVVIEEGATMRENQVVIRLPNPKEMRVKTRINDSKIKQVRVGNAVNVELDVNPDLPVRGVVSKVNPYPYPREWYGGPIEYGAEITIVNPPPELTPGQRAKVRIFVEELDDVVQMPIQSVVERAGSHYCLVRNPEGNWLTRRITIGSNNGSFVVIDDGIDDGEQVALNPDLLWDDVSSEENEETPKQPAGMTESVADGTGAR